MNEKVLIIDSDEKNCESLKIRLEGENYRVIISHSAVEGLRKIKEESPEIAILDYQIPDRNSIEVLNEIRKNFPNTFVIITSGQGIDE